MAPTHHPDISLAILAGGRGRRMGVTAKGLLEFGGRPILERLLQLAEGYAECSLVGTDLSAYSRYALDRVADVHPGRGAPGGVHAALAHASTPWVAVVACDMPLIRAVALDRLAQERSDAVDVLCFEVEGRPQPLVGLYRTSLATAWAHALEASPSMSALLAASRTRVLPEAELAAVDPHRFSVRGVNSPEELEQLSREWGSGGDSPPFDDGGG